MSCKIAVIDTRLGNVRSVLNAMEAIGADVTVTSDEAELTAADKLILPGVGAFRDGMASLQEQKLVPVLNRLVLEARKPILGICLGMQLFAGKSFENGEYNGLGWLDADVIRFETARMAGMKVPHVGWNDVTAITADPLLGDTGTVHSYYFVHSYHMVCHRPEDVIGSCDYGYEFPAVIRNGNIYGAQFHPEKSQKYGLALLTRFITQVETKSQAEVEGAAC